MKTSPKSDKFSDAAARCQISELFFLPRAAVAAQRIHLDAEPRKRILGPGFFSEFAPSGPASSLRRFFMRGKQEMDSNRPKNQDHKRQQTPFRAYRTSGEPWRAMK